MKAAISYAQCLVCGASLPHCAMCSVRSAVCTLHNKRYTRRPFLRRSRVSAGSGGRTVADQSGGGTHTARLAGGRRSAGRRRRGVDGRGALASLSGRKWPIRRRPNSPPPPSPPERGTTDCLSVASARHTIITATTGARLSILSVYTVCTRPPAPSYLAQPRGPRQQQSIYWGRRAGLFVSYRHWREDGLNGRHAAVETADQFAGRKLERPSFVEWLVMCENMNGAVFN